MRLTLPMAKILSVFPGLTPHGLRYTYKTMMKQLRTPAPLMDVLRSAVPALDRLLQAGAAK